MPTINFIILLCLLYNNFINKKWCKTFIIKAEQKPIRIRINLINNSTQKQNHDYSKCLRC
jgi:hypothetical protein